jgi:hypothetical protein
MEPREHVSPEAVAELCGREAGEAGGHGEQRRKTESEGLAEPAEPEPEPEQEPEDRTADEADHEGGTIAARIGTGLATVLAESGAPRASLAGRLPLPLPALGGPISFAQCAALASFPQLDAERR